MRMQHTGSIGTNGHIKPPVCLKELLSCPMNQSAMVALTKSKLPKAPAMDRKNNGKKEKETEETMVTTPRKISIMHAMAFCRLILLASLAVGMS
jgi:hypothetical protein